MRMTRALLMVFTLILLSGIGAVYAHSEEVSEKYEKAVNPVEVTEDSLEAGKNIYAQKCAACHGADGKGTSPGMPDFTDHGMMEEMGESVMFQKISEGVPGTPMPPWEDALTEEERWMVINYINTMHHGEEGPGEVAHTDEIPHADEADSGAQDFAAAPEKGICGPTAILFLAALPLIFRVGRRRK